MTWIRVGPRPFPPRPCTASDDPSAAQRAVGDHAELSTIDSSIFLSGALFCQSWFDRDDPGAGRVRCVSDLYAKGSVGRLPRGDELVGDALRLIHRY